MNAQTVTTSLPFTGRPFVEAAASAATGTEAGASLPFTGRPFVEASSEPPMPATSPRVAALHRAALR